MNDLVVLNNFPFQLDAEKLSARVHLPEDDADLDLSQIVYDYLCLALPPQRFHPDGECNPEVLKYLADGIKVEGKDKTGNPFSVLEGFLADKKE